MNRFEDQLVVDAHQHVWDLTKIQLPWLQDPAFEKLARRFSIDDYAEATCGVRIAKTLYVEVDARPADHLAELHHAVELCRDTTSRMAGIVCGARPADKGFREHLRRLQEYPYTKGVREILFDRPAGYCLDNAFLDGVRLIGQADLRFDIEIPLHYLPDAETLIKSCPETYFVMDHCGHPDLSNLDAGDWKTWMSKIAERDNVAIKLSGLFSGAAPQYLRAEAIDPVVNHLFAAFGSSRVLFGSDWPVVTLTSSFKEWLAAVWGVVEHRSTQQLHQLFHDNAVRVYGLQ